MNDKIIAQEWGGLVPIADLKLHPDNAREGDVGAIYQSIQANQFYGAVIVQKSTGHVLAGNHRLKAAVEHDMDKLPVIWVDCDDERARKIVVGDNRLSDLASWNEPALAELLQSVLADTGTLAGTGFDQEALDNLLADLASPHIAATTTEPAEEEAEAEPTGQIYALREDALFPSSNAWGIPDLLPEVLATQAPRQLWTGGECDCPEDHLFIFRTAKFGPEAKGGTLAFYVDDWRFENLWTDAVAVVEEFLQFGWGAIVTPDFSIWRDDPMAVQLWNVYRSRWCARYWQAAGIKIIPSLNWSDERSYEFALAGIPCGIPVASVQCRTTRSRKGKEYFIAGIRHAIEQVRPGAVLVYGGLEGRTWLEPTLPNGLEYIWLDNWMTARKKVRTGELHEEAELAA